MRDHILVVFAATVLLTAGPALPQATVNVPLGARGDVQGLKLVPIGGVKARAERVDDADNGKAALKVTFQKTGEERRLLALEARPRGSLIGVRAVALRYRLKLAKGRSPRPAVTVFEQGGGVWFKVGSSPVTTGEFADRRLSVASLRQAAFSDDESGELEWDNVEKVWIGLVIDGPAEGTFELSDARLTSEPYKPTQPLRITGDGPGKWNVGKDPAVKATLTTPAEGPGGKSCMKFEFRFPGGRHMYAVPSTPVQSAELEGYRALRFTYKATLPEGIQGLLVMLGERGGAQYCADPAPPPSADWTTLTIPLEKFKLGGWSKDANGRLDLEQVGRVMIAAHGTAAGAGGTGTIWVTDIELVP